MSKHGDKRVAAATLLRFKIYKVSLDCGDYYVDRNDIVMVDLVHTNNNKSVFPWAFFWGVVGALTCAVIAPLKGFDVNHIALMCFWMCQAFIMASVFVYLGFRERYCNILIATRGGVVFRTILCPYDESSIERVSFLKRIKTLIELGPFETCDKTYEVDCVFHTISEIDGDSASDANVSPTADARLAN